MSTNDMPSAGTRFGYIVSILINFALIYVANNLLVWNVPYLTNDFMKCLWAIDLSLAATIFTNFIFLFFDRKWFHSLMEAFAGIFSLVSAYIFWQVFPLDLSTTWAYWVNIGLIVLLIILVLSILSQTMNAVKYYRRDSRA